MPVIVAVPMAVGAKLTEQLEAASVSPTSIQKSEEKDPMTPLPVKVTFPVGTVAALGDLSDTVIVHEFVWPTITGLEQVISVVVTRTVLAKFPDPELPV